MEKNIICVACPMGCEITVTLDDTTNEIISVKGNTCKRGDAYARTECTNPVRSFTTTVKVSSGEHPVVPCKSSSPLPKGKVLDCADFIRTVCVDAPVKIGDVLIKNILDTGVDIVATNYCEKV